MDMDATAARVVGSGARALVRQLLQAQLQEICRAGKGGIFVLAGPPGVGKSWLARAVVDAMDRHDAFTGYGKYSEGGAPVAFGPVMAALSTVVELALDRPFDLQTGIASLVQELGVDLEVLISAGLSSPRLAARREVATLADRRGSTRRIIAAVLHLLSWLERFKTPVILLIDDWRRASPDGRELFDAMASAPRGAPVLFLTQREADIDTDAGEAMAPILHRLGPLSDAEIQALFVEALGDAERASLVIGALGPAVPRLPFDVLQVAGAFAEKGALFRRGDRWQLDPVRVHALAFDAETRIARLTDDLFEAAAALALWQDSAPLEAFGTALGSCAVTRAQDDRLDRLRVQGIIEIDAARVMFRHDRLRKAVLDRASPLYLGQLSGDMADRLPRHHSTDEIEIAALRLRHGGGIEPTAHSGWRDRFAAGATMARERGDAQTAADFAECAWLLRTCFPPEDVAADRRILREAVLAAADRDDPETEIRARALVATSRNAAETCGDYEMGVVALRLAEQREAAWRMACDGLRYVGITPPADLLSPALLVAAVRWRLARRYKPPVELGDPAGSMDAFTGIAAASAVLAYHRDPRAAALIGFRAALLARRTSLRSAYWQSVDAFLFAALGARAQAADAGERALALVPHQRVLRASTLYQAIFFGVHWRRSLASQRGNFPEVTRIALSEGDLVTAAYGLRIFIMSGWRTCASLDHLLEEAIAARRSLRRLGEGTFVEEMDAMVAMLEGLTGRVAWRPDIWRTDIPTRNHVIDLELANLSENWPETLRRADRIRHLRRDYDVQADSVVLRFHETLARLRCGLNARRSDMSFMRRAARLNPDDHRSKLLLLDAEILRRRGTGDAVLAAFAGAVEAADRADSRLDAILAASCAANAADALSEPDIAQGYRNRAEETRRGWNARGIPNADPVRDAPHLLVEARARAVAAERADQAKSRLLAHVGHELRTPLQALQTMLDLSADGREQLDMTEVRAVLHGLTAVVEDLNTIGNFGEDRTTGLERAVDLHRLVQSEMAIWRAGAKLTLHVRGVVPVLDVAGDRVRQVVRNLLSNAVKYGGGSVAVGLGAAHRPNGAVRVVITVSDRGEGIAPALRDRIFEPFERGTFAGDGKGAGLGLALSRRLAERLGGELTVHNRRGGGARFTFQFTASPAADAITRPALAARPADLLLVEDSPLIRRLLVAILARAGHRVVEAGDAEGGCAILLQRSFDLAILDMGLPGAGGGTVLQAMRATQAGAGVPVILLTASTTGEAEALAHGDPLVRVLRKPASARLLIETIATLLGGQVSAAAWNDADAEMQPLFQAAREEIIRQARQCVAQPEATTPAALHQLAGLAAQFGWLGVALAIEDFGAANIAGLPLAASCNAILAALEAMNAA